MTSDNLPSATESKEGDAGPSKEPPARSVFHYTDKSGWNAIRSQRVWRFKTYSPADPNRPVGAYFTDIEPTETNLRILHKRIRVPKFKQEYVFWFLGDTGLVQLNAGRGRDKHILFSPNDYDVSEDRQKYGDETRGLVGRLP